MATPKRVLMISYFFTPSPAVGAARAAKFYEHLPEFGWEPHVLTVRQATPPHTLPLPRVTYTHAWRPWHWLERRRARAAAQGQPAAARTLHQVAHRSAWGEKFYYLLRHILPMSSVRMPDATLGWYPFAVRAGEAILRAQPFDALWSSAGPPSSHLVAARLHSLTGVPWVADFRDLWSLNYYETRISPFQAVEARLERRVMAGAARLTTISEGLARLLADFYGREVAVVYNGYDDALPRPSPAPSNGFGLCYTGALYPGKQDIRPFFQAVAQAREIEPGFSPRIRLVGPDLDWLTPLAQEYGLGDIVRYEGFLPREQVLALQQSSTALLLLGWNDAAAQPGVLPVKMFEYLRAGRPILEIGSRQNESAAIIARCRAGLTAEQPAEIRAILLAWWDEFRRAGAVACAGDAEQISRYSRRAQTERLAAILEA